MKGIAYLTSRPRPFDLPDNAVSMSREWRYNLWKDDRISPYGELRRGDTVYWYDTPRKLVVWSSHVIEIREFPFSRKDEVANSFQLPPYELATEYYEHGPTSGVCLAFRIEAVTQLSIGKPSDITIPRTGWLPIRPQLATVWPELFSQVEKDLGGGSAIQ